MRDIEARTAVPAPAPAVFAFLSKLGNHWRVADRFVDVVTLDPAGGVVRVRGPLGLRRTAATRVELMDPPHRIVGSARIGRRTRARVSWTLADRDGITNVRLAAQLESASAVDRLLIALGGRRWLTHRFASALARLGTCFGPGNALSPARQDAQRPLGLGPVAGEVRGR
jgi:polyketide cyclase/dehydrase/lipid transport protein